MQERMVEKIIAEIDKRTLLGAAYDTMSQDGKLKFRLALINIITDTITDQKWRDDPRGCEGVT
jgi:hypothetical protein